MSSDVFITGANKGLGAALVEAFLADGFRVFSGYRAAMGKLDELVRRHPERVVPVVVDVTDAASVRRARDEIASVTKCLEIVVNNAAILPRAGRGSLEATNIEIGVSVFDANALGPLRVTQAFVPLLRAGTRRLIVNVSSEAGSIADCWRKDDHLYCMSKAALNLQSAILKNDLGREGFEILAVHPGWMRTEMGGSKADIDATEAALGIVELTRTRRDEGEPFFVDYAGEPLRW